MSASGPAGLLNQNKSEWATESLTKKIMSNPRLAIGMTNPKFMRAIEDMKENPEMAMKKYKGQKEIEDFMTEFAGVMGEHFKELGETQEENLKEASRGAEPKGIGPLAEDAIRREKERQAKGEVGWDEAAVPQHKVDEIINDRDVAGILMDPEMQKVLQECQLPGRMGKYMNDQKWGPKIRLLIDKGLLKVER